MPLDTGARRGAGDNENERGAHARLFKAEAAYADSIVRTALGDSKGAIAALRLALNIAPAYPPAIFSLGTVEYQLGRREAGRRLFHSLIALPVDTSDLISVIDHAGDFLIDRGAYEDGLKLYRAATFRFPNVAVFHQGLGCCAGHQGFHSEAIAASRRALALEPENQQFVNDLGWSLLEAGQHAEAEQLLSRAVAMDPNDPLAAENLRFCRQKATGHRRSMARRGRSAPLRVTP